MRLDLLKAKGVNAEMTVFPVRIGDRTMPEAGEVLALFLERGGMQNIDWRSQAFPRTGEAASEQISSGFGDYVRRNAIPTEYALYAEVLFTPGVGVAEVRGVLVDKQGNLVWSYQQTPQDEEFKERQPREPMECLVMLVNALREPLSLRDPFGPDAYQGRLAKRSAERTGLPTESERTAMQKARLDARTKFADSTVVVFPVLIDGQPHRQQAAHLAEALNEKNLGKVKVSVTQPAIEIQKVPNEQQRLWQMARAIREHLRQTPVAADYAIYADYVFAPNGKAFTVHFVVCDGTGEWVIVDFQNSHQPDFQAIKPKSGDDCDRLVMRRLCHHLSGEK
jgi:hypothetical protein